MKRAIARSIVFVLIAILGLLIFYYFNLLKPKTSVQKVQVPKEIKFIRSIYGPSNTDRFEKPHDVTLDKDNNIYVADMRKGRIVIFDSNGNYLRTISNKGTKKDNGMKKSQFKHPAGVGVDTNGDIYIADNYRHAIVVFDNSGKFLREWRAMTPLNPRILKDKVYLTTYGPFYIYDKKGKVLSRLGKQGRKVGQFYYPNGVGFSDTGDIYIADSMNNRIIALAENTTAKWTSGKPSTLMTDNKALYDIPNGIAVDENGLIYTMEFLSSYISVVSDKGKKIDNFGEMGSADGLFLYPSSIAYQGNRRFVIADEGNNRIQILEIPITEKMSKAIKKETGKTVAVTANESFFSRIINFIKTLIGS